MFDWVLNPPLSGKSSLAWLIYRSSRPEVFCKRDTGTCEFCEIFKNTHPLVTASGYKLQEHL